MNQSKRWSGRCRVVAALVALAVLAACDEEMPVATPSFSEALEKLEFSAASPLADGAMIVQISAQVPAGSTLQPRLVAFSTSAGTFVQGGTSVTTSAGADGKVRAFLRAPIRADTARIRASAGGTILIKDLPFAAALPQTLEIEPDSFSVQADPVKGGQTITITAFVRRASGAVTPGQEVGFSADLAGSAPPRIGVASRSDSAGKVTVKYSPGPTSYRGPIVIRAQTVGENNRVLAATTTIDIIGWKQP
jgi:hypothetical protein